MARRILFFVSSMNSGGAERVAANLANAWVERGDAVTLVVTYSGRGECFYPLSEKVQLLYLADLAEVVGRGLSGYWGRFQALRHLIQKVKPDVMLSFLTNVNVAVLLASIGLSCRVIVAEHTFPPMLRVSRMEHWFRRRTYPFAKYVVMLTDEGLAWLSDRIPSANGVVIPNPVPYPLVASEPCLAPDHYLPVERKSLLAVGRLDGGKQFDRLLDAFAKLVGPYPQWDLAILGEGPDRGALEAQVERLGLGGRAFLPGRAGNVGDWYTRADLYVMSSRFEGFPNTLAEAMAHSCAAVSYDCDTGPRDIIRDGVDGLLVTPVGDVRALTQTLDRLMGNEAERDQMAKRAIEVRDRFSMQRILTQWDVLFDTSPETREIK